MAKCKTFIEYNGSKASLFSWTSSMDCFSFSIPAQFSCPGMLARNSEDICFGCYASINRYNMPLVLNAQFIRFNWLRLNLKTTYGKQIIINTFVSTLKKEVKNNYFRWFDSGDIFNIDLLICLIEICKQTPDIKHWFPTRSYRLIKKS